MTLQSLRKPYFSKVQFCRHPVLYLHWFPAIFKVVNIDHHHHSGEILKGSLAPWSIKLRNRFLFIFKFNGLYDCIDNHIWNQTRGKSFAIIFTFHLCYSPLKPLDCDNTAKVRGTTQLCARVFKTTRKTTQQYQHDTQVECTALTRKNNKQNKV